MKKINMNEVIPKQWFKENVNKVAIACTILIISMAIIVNAVTLNNNNKKDEHISEGIVFAKDVSLNTKIPGRIAEILVKEGQTIKAGDPVVKISSEELEAKKLQLLAQIEQAKAGVEASQAVVDMAQANYKLAKDRIAQAKAGVSASEEQKNIALAISNKAENGARTQQVTQAESAYNLMAATYERALVLYEGGAISLQKLEEIQAQRDIYEQTLSMAKEGARTEDKAAANAQLAMAQSGVNASQAVLGQAVEASNVASAQVNQAQAGLSASKGKLEQANGGLQEVEVYLKDSVIKAPIDGTVTTINSDEGELVSTGSSIGTISNLENCYVNVNMDEDRLQGIEEGQIVSVHLIGYAEREYEGKVVTINKQPDFAVKKSTNENGNFDIVSFGVKVEMNNVEESIRPGMTATVDFETQETEVETEKVEAKTVDSNEADSDKVDVN